MYKIQQGDKGKRSLEVIMASQQSVERQEVVIQFHDTHDNGKGWSETEGAKGARASAEFYGTVQQPARY